MKIRHSEVTLPEGEVCIDDVFVEKATQHSATFIYGDMRAEKNIESIGKIFSFTSNFEHKVGFYYKIKGKWSEFRGKPQLKVTEVVEERAPKTEDGLIRFFQTFNDIGPARARKIVDRLGGNAIELVIDNPSLISDFVGSESRAIEISKLIEIDPEKAQIKQQMMGINISPSVINKIFDVFPGNAIGIIKEKPYELIYIDGIGFKTADSIALKIGNVSLNDPIRIRHIVKYIAINLIEGEDGDTVFDLKSFSKKAKVALRNLNSFDLDLTFSALENLVDEGEVKKMRFKNDESVYYQTKESFMDEKSISSRIVSAVSKIEPVSLSSIKPRLATMSKDQLEAISGITSQKISILTGGPGTGKSYIINTAKMAFRYEGRSVCIVAPTGKAAANVSGQTIHRALGWGVGGIMGPTETIEDDVLIVDESSMISNDLMLMLIVNTSKKTQIVFVGDPDQLPPIGKGEPFKNFIKSQVVPTFRLTKIHRQEGESAIPYLAKEIREGRIISVDDPSVEIVEDPSTGGKKRRGDDESPLERLTDRLIEKYLQLIISSKKTSNPISVEDVLILVPYSSSKMKPNATTINETLQHVRFKKFPNLYCYETKKKKFAKGDRVIRTKNKMIELSDGTIILNANGDMGTVVEGDAGGLYIEFDRDDIDEIIKIPRDEIRNIQLAYALTVHKAQGSEADYVVVAAHPSNRFLFDRSAFYTAVTRARKKVVIITPSREEAHKLYEKEKSARKSLLSFRMKTFLKERKKLWDAGQVERQRYVNFEKTLKKIKENSNDHYSLLGVSRSSTGEEIKAAFRKIAGDIHPDHNEIDTTKEFQAVNEAYQVLSDPGRRIKYDNKRRIQ